MAMATVKGPREVREAPSLPPRHGFLPTCGAALSAFLSRVGSDVCPGTDLFQTSVNVSKLITDNVQLRDQRQCQRRVGHDSPARVSWRDQQ